MSYQSLQFDMDDPEFEVQTGGENFHSFHFIK